LLNFGGMVLLRFGWFNFDILVRKRFGHWSNVGTVKNKQKLSQWLINCSRLQVFFFFRLWFWSAHKLHVIKLDFISLKVHPPISRITVHETMSGRLEVGTFHYFFCS
jgi:hypothetical protein